MMVVKGRGEGEGVGGVPTCWQFEGVEMGGGWK